MSVYTQLSSDFFEESLKKYSIGALKAVEPIKGGVTNTLYQIETDAGKYVFTLFESLKASELEKYVDLMQFLARQSIPCTCPIEDKQGQVIQIYESKPYLLAPYLPGDVVETPTESDCAQVGALLAKLHLVGQQFPEKISNQRNLQWCMNTYTKVQSKLETNQQRMIEAELTRHARINYRALPQGIIHADLFRDNVIFQNSKLSGCIDLYYACSETLIFDLAIAVNDWCLSQRKQAQLLINALMKGYNEHRILDKGEKTLFKEMLCLVSLRFWLSRLHDAFMHQESDVVLVKDPKEYEILLNLHRA